MALIAGRPVESKRYKLFGVLYHHGESTGSGHYTASVLRRNGDGSGEDWMHINDETMNAVRHEDMFGGNDDERVDDRCACMLFYCRTASARI
jgi:ubiquitin carboxyl-terminal hydrolase 10